MSTQICELGEEVVHEEQLDNDNLQSIVMDLSIVIDERLSALTSCYNQDQHHAVECLSTLVSQYQMSGIKNLEIFLRRMCEVSALPSFFRLEAAKALLEYEELEDDPDSENEDCAEIRMQNKAVRERNKARRGIGATGLEAICLTMGEMPTPCRVEAIYLLMEYPIHKTTSDKCFKSLVNDQTIECEFRYKCILDLEHRGAQSMRRRLIGEFWDKDFVSGTYEKFASLIGKEFPKFKPSTNSEAFFQLLIEHISYNQLLEAFRTRFPSTVHLYEYFLYEAQLSFLTAETNYTSYRILAAQYLLQKFDPTLITRKLIQETTLEFAQDPELDYNLRADATDVLMRLGDKDMKDLGRELILELGRSNGQVVTVFDNAQNVHTEEVEASVAEVLEFFSLLPLLKISKTPIEFPYIQKQVHDMLEGFKHTKSKEAKRVDNGNGICEYCENGFSLESKEGVKFCSKSCKVAADREARINLALNRIEMDRALYSRYNSTLVNILLKVWTYLTGHESEEEMQKRLLEELDEMSGTCSSGFASRLINVISGFGKFSIRISWEDQIKANLFGRLSAAARRINDEKSVFRKESYLTDLVMLCLNEDYSASGEDSAKARILKEFKEEVPSQEQVVNAYLCESREPRIQECLDQLSENVLNEMTISSALSSRRQYFSLFLRSHVAFIREEMYAEFKDFMDDTTFDLYMRKAMMHYEGAM
jgi:hypothetical protein